MAKNGVLVVEDEELMRTILRRLLEDEGYTVYTADSAEAALKIIAENEISVTLTDIKMPGMDGISLLDKIKTVDRDAPVIIMTAYSSVDTAVAALRNGAYDYITKPFVNEDLIQTVKNAIMQRELHRENRALRRELNKQYTFSEIVGSSDSLQEIFKLVQKVAGTNANVLIQGESGTGKELIARAIHFNSERSSSPFVAVNCGALPESLLESELFGHAKGAFTGAVGEKKGLFRSANGGTLFLDEVGEMPPPLQVKLLRALQEHEVTPVGSSQSVKFDARIIAATNRDLEAEVAAGRFREDLFYRMNVIEIPVPPLRERREDIPLLVKHFVTRNGTVKEISPDAMAALTVYDWPGNIRELENAIERASVLSGDRIDAEHLPSKVRSANPEMANGGRQTLDAVERKYIFQVLESVGDDKAQAARILDIDLSTLYRKLKRYDEIT
jgi:DNA-binding NtrC family response regulator